MPKAYLLIETADLPPDMLQRIVAKAERLCTLSREDFTRLFNEHQAEQEAECQHLTGYWINKNPTIMTFRCYECGCQFSALEIPKNRKRRIERWNAPAKAGEDPDLLGLY
jgi:hypothetical protein